MTHINERARFVGPNIKSWEPMELKPLSPTHAVSPQIAPEDVPGIAEAGFSEVICNRPDTEVPADLQSTALRAAVEDAGLEFIDNPVDGRAMTIQNVEIQKNHLGRDDRKVLAYCASGTRSAVMWALASAGSLPTDEILAATAAAGYRLDGLRPQIEALAES